jgi:hypothetical protein
MKKIHLIYLSVIAILFTTLLYLLYLNFYKPQSTSIPTTNITPTETPDPTTDWEIYVDEENNISFMYPSTYVLKEIDIPKDYFFMLQGKDYKVVTNDFGSKNTGTYYYFSINIACTPADIVGDKKILFSSDNYTVYSITGYEGPNYKSALFINNGMCWEFNCHSDYGCDGKQLEEFSQILSTFKFISQENVISDEQNLTKVLQSLIYPRSPEKVEIVPTIKDNFASGTYRIVLDAEGEGPGGGWIATKSAGKWILVEAFQEPPSCQLMEQYGVPATIYGSCIDK